MHDELGERLLQAGVITQAQLTSLQLAPTTSGGAIIRDVLKLGASENAVVSFFERRGYGPPIPPPQLAARDTSLTDRIPRSTVSRLLALPLQRVSGSILTAMADPSDRAAVAELAHRLDSPIRPVLARVSDMEQAIYDAYGDGTPSMPARRPTSSFERPVDEETPAFALVQRRVSDPGQPAFLPEPPTAQQIPTPDAAIPLVRVGHSTSPEIAAPDAHRATERGLARPTVPTEPSMSLPPVPARASRLPPPPEPIATPYPPAVPGSFYPPAAASRPASSNPPPAPLASSFAPAEAGTLQSVLPPAASARQSSFPPPKRPSTLPPPATSRSSKPPPTTQRDMQAANERSFNALTGRRNSVPSFNSMAGGPPVPIESSLREIARATDRDAVLKAACHAAATVCRSAVFLARRRDLLIGWDGAGVGITREAVRNLWLPISGPSVFRDALSRARDYMGPPGTSSVDCVYRAVTGSHGGVTLVRPVLLRGKVIALLAIDGLSYGDQGAMRITTVVNAVIEAFERIILANKAAGRPSEPPPAEHGSLAHS